MTLLQKLKEAVTGPTKEEIRELPHAGRPCPNCRDESALRVEKGLLTTMYRCTNCGSEGIGPAPVTANESE